MFRIEKMKTCIKILIAFGIVVVCNHANAASITLINNSGAGQFLLSDGNVPTAGGVSVGYFTGAAPSDSAIQALTAETAYSALIGLGFVDIRVATNTTQDWDWPTVGGGITFTPGSGVNELPTGKQLYLLAFNAGSFVAGTPSSSFAGSTQWAVVKDNAAANTTPTSNLTTSNIVLSTANTSGVINANEVLVGTDGTGNSINMVGAVPEPSRALLGMIGLVALFVRRRR